MKKKKCYIGENICCPDDGILGIVAYSSKEAIQIARQYEGWDCCDYPFINTRVRWQRNINVEGLPLGEMDLVEGVKRGVYAYVWGLDCDVCENFVDDSERAYWIDNKLMCEGCEEKFLSLNPQN